VKGSETAKFLAEIVHEVLSAWAIDKECIVAIASDGGTNMKAAVTKQLNIGWVYINQAVNLALAQGQGTQDEQQDLLGISPCHAQEVDLLTPSCF